MSSFNIGGRLVDESTPTYFIADVASNHDGDLGKAKELIFAAADAGADAAKFQHFRAETLISKKGFELVGGQIAHQSNWEKSVYEVYEAAETKISWTEELYSACQSAGIDFFSSAYDLESIDIINPFVNVFKVGSGDIDWLEGLQRLAEIGKPVIVATGAAELSEVKRIVEFLNSNSVSTAILQCNTNYSGSDEVFEHMNINVLNQYKNVLSKNVLGLSDHSQGHSTVLGAIALGARIVEKHFTLDNASIGPDHYFSLNPETWSAMISDARRLELSLGDGKKKVEDNERETIIVQRRGLYASEDLTPGTKLTVGNTHSLRPCLPDQLSPWLLTEDPHTSRAIEKDAPIFQSDIG